MRKETNIDHGGMGEVCTTEAYSRERRGCKGTGGGRVAAGGCSFQLVPLPSLKPQPYITENRTQNLFSTI